MYNTIEKIVVNQKSYYVYKEVLNQYHHFATILQDCSIKIIEININEPINFTKVIDIMYKYYYDPYGKSNYFKGLSFYEFINIFYLLQYLQPINAKNNITGGMMYEITKNYAKYLNVDCDVTIDNIISANIDILYKKILLEQYIKNTNKLDLVIILDCVPNDHSVQSSYQSLKLDRNLVKCDNIANFFQQYNIRLNTYSLEVNFVANEYDDLIYECVLYIDNKKFIINIKITPKLGYIYLFDPLCDILINDFLLK